MPRRLCRAGDYARCWLRHHQALATPRAVQPGFRLSEITRLIATAVENDDRAAPPSRWLRLLNQRLTVSCRRQGTRASMVRLNAGALPKVTLTLDFGQPHSAVSMRQRSVRAPHHRNSPGRLQLRHSVTQT